MTSSSSTSSPSGSCDSTTFDFLELQKWRTCDKISGEIWGDKVWQERYFFFLGFLTTSSPSVAWSAASPFTRSAWSSSRSDGGMNQHIVLATSPLWILWCSNGSQSLPVVAVFFFFFLLWGGASIEDANVSLSPLWDSLRLPISNPWSEQETHHGCIIMYLYMLEKMKLINHDRRLKQMLKFLFIY